LVNGPPDSGDWIITSPTTVENGTGTLNGNLVIKSGGSLTMKNAKLVINGKKDGDIGISVGSGGSLFIYQSTITSVNPKKRGRVTGFIAESPRFYFKVKDAKFEMKDSEIWGAGWAEPFSNVEIGGLLLQNVKGAVIEGNTFAQNYYGLLLVESNSVSVRNNSFIDNDNAGIYLLNSDGTIIRENNFASESFGIHHGMHTKHSIIEDNNFYNCLEAAVFLFGGCEHNSISANTIYSDPKSWAGVAIGGSPIHTANNNSIFNNSISNGKHGLVIYHSSGNIIESNTIKDAQCGVALGYASKNVFNSNDISYAGQWGSDTQQHAFILFHSSENIIANNSISQTKVYGILLLGSSNANTIQGNIIKSCQQGIGVYSSDNNSIVNNAVTNSDGSSITLKNTKGNKIYSNKISDNAGKPYDNGGNQWDNQGSGNFWSDYDGKDANNDGIGDTPQSIETGGIDRYPMVKPLTIEPFPIPVQEDIPIPVFTFPGTEVKEISGDVVWQDQTITLDRSELRIRKGCSLILKNTTLIIPRGCDGIYVESGGSLSIYNSKIVPTEDGGGFLFTVYWGGILIMKDSELYGCGFNPDGGDWGGLYLFTDKATIENNIISNSPKGIDMASTSSSLKYTSIYVKNNTISDCYWGMQPLGPIEGHIEGNKILNCLR
jgi:parallel beta-helix repeat protein